MIGQRLKALRENAGLTLEQVSEQTGINLQQISRYEHNKSRPLGDQLVALADFYKVSTDFLLGRSDEQQPGLSEDDLTVWERKLLIAVRQGRIIEAVKSITTGDEIKD